MARRQTSNPLFTEVRGIGILRSSAIIQNQDVGRVLRGSGLFVSYASACISERVSAHSILGMGKSNANSGEVLTPASLKRALNKSRAELVAQPTTPSKL